MSRPRLPLFLLSESEESAICLNSSRTKLGIIILPSIKPVLSRSSIRPSIITLVSRILGFPLVLFLLPLVSIMPPKPLISSFLILATLYPRKPNMIFKSITMLVPIIPYLLIVTPIRFAITRVF